MSNHSNTWLGTRPTQPPNSPFPAPDENVIYRVPDVDGTVELWVIRHSIGTFGFEYMTWAKLSTAGDDDYHNWMTLHPDSETYCATPEMALQIGKEDARQKGLKLLDTVRVNYSV